MSTAVTTEKKPGALTIRDHLNSPSLMNEIARVLPKHLTADRMIRVALTALTKTPKLTQCTQASFFECLLNCSQWGLEPDGRRAHLIPYKEKCTLVIDYKGVLELCYRAGTLDTAHADVVRRGDIFKFSAGYVVDHVPWFLRDPNDRPEKPGDIFAVYCIVRMKSGAAKHDVMSVDDVNAIRDKSQGYIAYKKNYVSTSPWVDYWNEMAKKTVFKRASKWLPWSAEIMEAMEKDDGAIDVESRPTTTTRIASSLDALVADHTETPADESADTDEQAPQSEEPAKWEAELANCETVEQCDDLLAWVGENMPADKTRDLATSVISKKIASLKKKPTQRELGA